MLRDQITDELKVAMKAKDLARVGTIRLILAAIKDRDIQQRGDGKDPLGDAGILDLMQKMIKQRRDSIEAFEKGGRPELAAKEQAEIDIIASFMPRQLSESETEQALGAAIAEAGASGVKDMGRVMALLKEKFAGRMDFGKASGRLKQLLA